MWVRLIRSHGKIKMGKVIKVIPSVARKMIEDKRAIEYTDGFPVKKIKTDFFKPK